jgi:hypothetical protein
VVTVPEFAVDGFIITASSSTDVDEEIPVGYVGATEVPLSADVPTVPIAPQVSAMLPSLH